MSVTTAARLARPTHRYQLETMLAHLSPAERAVRGKAARAEVPLESHAAFDPPAGRPDPVALLEEQAASRVPELVPVRYGRMMVSPFTCFRGAALPMASDLAATPVSGLAVQACGDAHLSNFGVFGSAERRLVFDVNVFDETLPGPWEWDVKRLAASVEVAARDKRVHREEAPRDRGGLGRPVPGRHARVCRDDQPGSLVCARRPARAEAAGRVPPQCRGCDQAAYGSRGEVELCYPALASAGSPRSRWSSWSLRVIAALISDRCVNACGKLPSCSPVDPISSEYRPRWLA
jgi:Uncharacterized protein conserved in bacteria (DUF2252)